MSAAEVLAAHAIECTGPGEVSCRCRIVRWMSWPDYHQHQADMLAAAGLLVTPQAAMDATGAVRNLVRNAVSNAHADTCVRTTVTASNYAIVDAALGALRNLGLPASALEIAEHDREVAARAWDEGRESVGRDLSNPRRPDGMRPSSTNPYRIPRGESDRA